MRKQQIFSFPPAIRWLCPTDPGEPDNSAIGRLRELAELRGLEIGISRSLYAE